jgi:tRNA threonylcarbamoyladenosine biosynthesis protein TsaE
VKSTKAIQSLEEMRAFAQECAANLPSRALLLLDGPMGAGKTQFSKFLVEALGSSETVSPSFAIHNSYAGRDRTIEHFDLFRLESEEDLESTGFWDFFRAKEGLVIIEWSEKLDDFGLRQQLPRSWWTQHLQFQNLGGESRVVEVTTRS